MPLDQLEEHGRAVLDRLGEDLQQVAVLVPVRQDAQLAQLAAQRDHWTAEVARLAAAEAEARGTLDGIADAIRSAETAFASETDALPADEAGPLARYASTIQAQRHDYNGKVLSIRAEDLKSLAIIYDMSPDELTSRLIEWGVLSPGADGTGYATSEEEDDPLDWERRRSPR